MQPISQHHGVPGMNNGRKAYEGNFSKKEKAQSEAWDELTLSRSAYNEDPGK